MLTDRMVRGWSAEIQARLSIAGEVHITGPDCVRPEGGRLLGNEMTERLTEMCLLIRK